MSSTLTAITKCSGFFMDSGGGNGNYLGNQHFTTTICPDGTTGTHTQLVFGSTNFGAGDELCFFDGPTTASPALSCASDFTPGAAFIIQATAVNTSGCITVTFDSDGIGEGAGWSANINCIPSCQTILSVLDNTNPTANPVDTGWIDICPGERVFFYGKGAYPQNGAVYNHSDLTSSFEWDFGDGGITYGPTVSHIFDEPGGYVVQLEITDQLGCKNTNFVSQRVRVAPRPYFMLGAWPTEICAGDTISLNDMVNATDPSHTVSVLPNEGSFQTAGIRADSLALPDGDGSCYVTNISFTSFSPGQILTNISDLIGIFVTMEHSWMRDLEITLTCPNGQSAILHNHPGQTGGEIFLGIPNEADEGFPVPIPGTGYDYGWSSTPDFNQTWIQYANTHPNIGTLPEGTYNSFQPLTNFLGCPLNGDWEIEVCDHWGIDNGYIFSWGIEFDPSLYPSVETFSPDITSWGWNNHPSILYSSADSLVGSPINAGEVAYTFTVNDAFGCSWDTTVNLQVLPETHPLCHACEDILVPAPDTVVCVGEPVAINVSSPMATTQNVTFESYDDYPLGASNHPVANPYNSVIAINSITPGTIANATTDILSVCIDIATDFDADLQIFLKSPNNQLLMLSTNNGGSGDNYTQTCFTPTAVTPITSGVAPFTGNFQPEGSWSVLNGVPVNGNWTLRVTDAFGLNAMGRVNWWSITFRSQNNVTYTWTPSGGLSCNNCSTPIATPMANTNYIVTASDGYGCIKKDTVNITVLSSFNAPTVALTQNTSGEIIANWNDVNPGSSYEVNVNNTGWIPANNGNLSHIVSGLLNGNAVTVEVRTMVGGAACQVGIGAANMVYQFCPIFLSIDNPAPYAVSCNGVCDESVQISVSNGQSPFNFNITNTTTGTMFSQMTGNINGLCPGVFSVLVTDATGCSATIGFTVNDQPPIIPAVTQVSPVSCFGGSDGCAQVVASGGVGGYTYQWSTPNMPTTSSVCGLSVGPITVSVTDLNGCVVSGSINITSQPAIALNITKTDVKCKGGNDGSATVTPSGGAGGFTFQWSTGNTPTQATTSGLIAGNVSVTVTDVNGCQAFGNIAINEPATGVQAIASQTLISCYSENKSVATVMPTGGTGPYTYAWSPGGLTTQTISNISIGQYTVTVTDVGGCTATSQVNVTQWPAYNLLISTTPPTCSGNADGQMNVVVLAGGNGTYTYAWSNGQTTDVITGLLGAVTYTVTVTDGQGCTGTMSRLLSSPAPLVLTLAQTPTKCAGSPDGSATVANVSGGTSPFTYQWGAAANNQTTATATNLGAGTYSVVVTGTGGCTNSGTITVTEPMSLSANFTIVNNECFGYENGEAEVKVTGGVPGFTYQWSNNATTDKIIDLAAGSYYLTITDANGCSTIDSVFIAAPQSVTADLTIQDVACFGDRNGSIKITPIGGTPPFTYSLDGQQFYGSSTLIALAAGDYTVYLKDAEGCIFDLDATVNEPPQMTVDILVWGESLDEYMVEYGATFPLIAETSNAQGSVMYFWDASYCGTLAQDTMSDCTGTLTSSAIWSTPDYANDYFILAVDSLGCEAEDHLKVFVTKSRRVLVPTGFSPNQNGTNDLLIVHGKKGTMIKSFQVFDRWGELLWQDVDIPINEPARGWDGTFKSKDMPAGVYVWYLEAEYEDGMKESLKGETTLIR
ncbi:MAG: proprotein convertase P-domain-containing protein [Saprospiraceae bacterium]|nr:proprotein convertase P-domain-containing protein [Saprospiraceae bacterium]MCF8248442.1 proprotein convertase P-domain-containing protein [Saprospiraceae bacterium]MCF8281324.1 proprotein convertase P-domain-containing protein [Bacteroidales bacterium]MCF8309970.1 proprotein convertase P-domain-containing protein [Saprospiraceae bacterium]MCF8438699.1 proprotein convertase P-domain-containing protein [Saprospiraceae bacterium]